MTGDARDHRGQIKTRERVRRLAEVYTHGREIEAMLDLIPDMFPSTAAGADIKFLEPACGSGNFLEEILLRKLRHIQFRSIRSVGAYEHRILRAIASIYGIDICAENVTEARDRMLAGVLAHYRDDANSTEPTAGFASALQAIISSNVQQADMLADGAVTELIDYQSIPGGYFQRVWSMLSDSAAANTQLDLFHQEPAPKRDEVPIHYLDLAALPTPTRVEQASNVRRNAVV
jgi:hypothetical protein